MNEDARTEEQQIREIGGWIEESRKVRKIDPSIGQTGYLGVSRTKAGFKAQLMHQRQNYGLGTFRTPEQAARAFDAKAVELRGPGTRLNFPGEHRSEAV